MADMTNLIKKRKDKQTSMWGEVLDFSCILLLLLYSFLSLYEYTKHLLYDITGEEVPDSEYIVCQNKLYIPMKRGTDVNSYIITNEIDREVCILDSIICCIDRRDLKHALLTCN